MTDTNERADLDAIEAAYNAATPGAWMDELKGIWSEEQTTLGIFPNVGHMSSADNAAFTAFAHNITPALIAELRALRQQISEAERWDNNASLFRREVRTAEWGADIFVVSIPFAKRWSWHVTTRYYNQDVAAFHDFGTLDTVDDAKAAAEAAFVRWNAIAVPPLPESEAK